MSKKQKAPEKDNAERWLLTYSDLMNLLLILFIILYCSSQVDKNKAEQVAKSVREGFGYIENGGTGATDGTGSGVYGITMEGSAPPSEGQTAAENSAALASGTAQDGYWSLEQKQSYEKFYNEVMDLLNKNNLAGLVEVTLDDTGVVISFKEKALFASGSAELNDASNQVIANIGNLLKGLDFSQILVAGHTDTDPIHTAQYKDNTDLSLQRAYNVWRDLVNSGLPPEKMTPIGYGEFRPIAPNDTPENKAKNRRVVVDIMRNQLNAEKEITTSDPNKPVDLNPPASSPAAAGNTAAAASPSAAAHASASPSAAKATASPSAANKEASITPVQPSVSAHPSASPAKH